MYNLDNCCAVLRELKIFAKQNILPIFAPQDLVDLQSLMLSKTEFSNIRWR